MCTTMMVLTTIAVILRQRFSNKIKPFLEKHNQTSQKKKEGGQKKKIDF
uniref:Uncharacterized protein n=1 Tax=Poecilia reticulata TaxID=8081 RepID=A0A3P9PPG2_POERE